MLEQFPDIALTKQIMSLFGIGYDTPATYKIEYFASPHPFLYSTR